jgi:hypothetical protein
MLRKRLSGWATTRANRRSLYRKLGDALGIGRAGTMNSRVVEIEPTRLPGTPAARLAVEERYPGRLGRFVGDTVTAGSVTDGTVAGGTVTGGTATGGGVTGGTVPLLSRWRDEIGMRIRSLGVRWRGS